TGGSVSAATGGSVNPGTGGSVSAATGGSVNPGTGGSANPGTGGSTNPDTDASTPPPDASVTPDGGAEDAGLADASDWDVPDRDPAPYPEADPAACGSWALTDNVCCAQYCADDESSQSCENCGGPGAAGCTVVSSKACVSGKWPEVHAVSDDEPWHYSRSTHFGLTDHGACAFGLYALCSSAFEFADGGFGDRCDAFCTAYPDLCRDPEDITLRGNFAAPQGNYYTQFWPSLPGDNDNYLSCGECFELVRTKKDGSDYQPGEEGYTPPIVLQVIDSCPCAPNSKWCCGSGRDHCAEVSDFEYGCPLPPDPPPPADHDPVAGESIHLDLSDIAMARLQSGDPNGSMPDGVIPTRYRRVPCPVPGNIYVWLRPTASEYYFALSVVNAAGLGSITKVEAELPSGEWVLLERDKNYTPARPQERYGTWALPQGSGPFALPLTLRFTDGSGVPLVAPDAIKAWEAPDPAQAETYYIDTGVQFPK
ncbi:MAG: hypothetical protein JW940_31570, partial [Polyangiaceae bacterium]|nr:hypothetical protein [Polyangiaceae bacterium]